MNKSNINWKQNIKNTTKRVFIWTVLWVLSVALLTFGPTILWDFETGLTLAAAGLNILIGIKMIFTLKNNLDSIDELAQKIHRDAMAIAMGTGVVIGTCYEIFEDVKFTLLFLITITYVMSLAIGTAKYK